MGDTICRIGGQDSEIRGPAPSQRSKAAEITITDDHYGASVANFLASGSAQGFLSGVPLGDSNHQQITDDPQTDMFSCFVAGMPITLADGGTVAIESVPENAPVLGKDGGVSRRLDETMALSVKQDWTIFGIVAEGRVEKPFFSPGHLFWTDDGWKAIEPRIANA